MPAYKELLHHRLVATSMMYKKITYASAKMLKQKIQEVASKQDLSKTQTLSQVNQKNAYRSKYAKRHDGVQTCFVYLQCENVVYCYLVLICQNQQNSVINYLLPGLVVLEKIGIPSIASEPKISKLNIFQIISL